MKPQPATKPEESGIYWIKTAKATYDRKKFTHTWDNPKISDWEIASIRKEDRYYGILNCDEIIPWDDRNEVVIDVRGPINPPER